MPDSLQLHGPQHTRLLCPSPSSSVCSNSHPLSWWCHPTMSFSVVPFSSCLQSFPLSRSFPMSQLFISGGQIIWASAPVLPLNIQAWCPLRLIGLISLLSKGFSRLFFSTAIWNHQFSALFLLYCPALTSVRDSKFGGGHNSISSTHRGDVKISLLNGRMKGQRYRGKN